MTHRDLESLGSPFTGSLLENAPPLGSQHIFEVGKLCKPPLRSRKPLAHSVSKESSVELECSELGRIGPKHREMLRRRARMTFWGIATLPALMLSAGCPDPATQAVDDEIQGFELSIENRRVAITGDAIRVRQGQQVRLRWLTDEPTSIHLHGYDIQASLEPDTPVVWNFEANATGRFPIEAHGFGQPEESTQTHDHSDSHDHPSREPTPSIRSADEILLYFEVYPR